jgi:hypothetical protein
MGGCGGQDEHPRLKVLHEGVDENGGSLEGGGYDEDGREPPVIFYETDEDEFLDKEEHSTAVSSREPALIPRKGTHKRKNTAKRDVVAPKRGGSGSEYDLAYFKLWWARMTIEGRKQAKEQLRQDVNFNFNVTKGVRRGVRCGNVRREPLNDSVKIASNQIKSNQDQNNKPQDQENLRGGQRLDREHPFMGEGRGSPVSNLNDIITEQPRDNNYEKQHDSAADTGTGF